MEDVMAKIYAAPRLDEVGSAVSRTLGNGNSASESGGATSKQLP
jgi:hypothetical protein